MFRLKNESIYKTYKKNFISDWILILMGSSSVNPRRCINGNNFIYMSSRSFKKANTLPITERIHQILLWKKKIQQTISTKKNCLKEKVYRKVPAYSLDELVFHKFPSFSNAFQELLKFSSILYILSFKACFSEKNTKISDKFFHFLFSLKKFFPNLFKIKNAILSFDIFELKLKIRGKIRTLVFPKKIDEINVLREKKILKFILNFKIQVARNVILKILSVHQYKFLGASFYNLSRIIDFWFDNPKRYYKSISNRNFKFFRSEVALRKSSKLFCLVRKKIRKNIFQLWNFSKNVLIDVSRIKFRGIFFFSNEKIVDFFKETASSFLKLVYCKKKTDEEIIFCFPKNILIRISVISHFLFFSFVTDSLNLGIILPALAYCRKTSEVNLNLNNKSFKKKKSWLRLPKNFKNFYFDLNEISYLEYEKCIIKDTEFIKKLCPKKIFSRNFINLCFFTN